tara:strand:- start:2531 stop:2689 length:159 start_codon:yes stop_codon:yes gene_type:complete
LILDENFYSQRDENETAGNLSKFPDAGTCDAADEHACDGEYSGYCPDYDAGP